MQVPHQPDRQETQSQITQGGGNTVDVGHCEDPVEVHAVAVDVAGRIGQESDSLPEVGDGVALQGQHEPEDQADDGCDEDDSPQDVSVHFADGEAEQSHCDGNLRDGADPDVAGLTEPPPLTRVLA